MMLHVDGSTHAWLGGNEHQDLVAILDDATSEVYYARLVEQESTATVMAGLKAVIEQKGIFCSLYSDRGSHFFHTRTAGGAPDPGHKTQIRRALQQLGIEMIPANSPQARGRCERFFGTWQGRLPQTMARTGWGATTRREKSCQRANQHVAEGRPPEMNSRLRSRPIIDQARQNRRIRKCTQAPKAKRGQNKMACGSCWRCENVENPKAVSHNFHKRLGKLSGAKTPKRAGEFPTAPTRPYY